jgi:4-alpha-glucanotransferase
MEEMLAPAIAREQFVQYVLSTQWDGLWAYCRKLGLQIIGDLPIYVDHDSADVWCNRELFRLDGTGRPVVVAGVPPDYFSTTGQLWQNPLYDWEVHERSGFVWWLARLERALRQTDLVRIDHFRGLAAYWEVAAGAPDATGGRWVPAPGTALLEAAKARFPQMPFIAEDLGIITPDVRDLMHRFGLPGMRVLLFAFTDELQENPHAPHNVPEDVFLYTGTHDNPPVRGWYEACATDADRERVRAYLGRHADGRTLPETLIRLAMISQARSVIIPVQDLIGLGIEARTNTPGRPEGNWRWRLNEEMLTQDVSDCLAGMTRVCNRWR